VPGTDRPTWLETGGQGFLARVLSRKDLCTIVTPAEDYLTRVVLQEQRSKVGKRKWRVVSDAQDLTNYEAYLATEAQFRENLYELEGNTLEQAEGGAPLVALDCEMVQTTQDRELARVSMVDLAGEVVYDTFVKPVNPVTDYLTQFSGVRPEDLETAVPFSQVQADLSRLLSRRSIVCGHSLENDLRALKLVHRRVIDTSLLYPHPQPSYKYSLKRLAFNFLNAEIQAVTCKQGDGHDSVEDAQAALGLVKLKVQYGPEFGSMQKEYSNLFGKLTNAAKKSIIVGLETSSHLLDGNVSVDLSGSFEKYLGTNHSLIISKLLPSSDLDSRLETLAAELPENVGVIILSGVGDLKAVQE
jgi:DNA polymerase III epsilon subunit-like protein